MASIFKQKYTIPGKNGKRIRKQSKCWYLDFKDSDGTRKRVKGFKDKSATQQLAAKLEHEAELAEKGMGDKFAEHRKRPLSEHLEDFRQCLIAKGDTEKHAEVTLSRIKRVFEGCQFRKWDDISASRAQKYLAELRNREKGISLQTSNYYLQSIKQFCRWMVQDGRASESPLEHLQKLNTSGSHKQKRRALEPDEIRRLLEITETAPDRFQTTGPQRAITYRLAIETGLRASELRSLPVSSFDLTNNTVTLKAEDSKNSQEAVIPLRKETSQILEVYLRGKLPQARALIMPSQFNTAKMIRTDLETAGIDHKDNGKGRIDFHSLRHTTGSLLAASGTHPKVAQSIMRHSDINLTMSRYTHIFRGQESEAIENLPDFSLPSRGKQRATGTDDLPVDSAYKKLAKKSDFDGIQKDADATNWQSGTERKRQNHDTRKSLKSIPLGTKKEPMSSTDTGSKSNGPGRIRTSDQWIMSPLL